MSDLILGHDWVRPVHRALDLDVGTPFREPYTLVGVLARRARQTPQAPFLSSVGAAAPEHTYSYLDANRAVQQRAALLANSGLTRGGRVGVLGHNSVDFVFAILSVLEAGGVAVLLGPGDPPARIRSQLEFAQVRWLLHDSDCDDLAKASVENQRLWSFDAFDVASRTYGEAPPTLRAATDAALIVFTSGTTGEPKAVVQSHYAVAQNAVAVAQHHRLGPGVRLLCVLPLHHVNGLEFTIFAVLLGGGHTLLSRGFDGLAFWSIVRKHDVHIASLVPNLLRLLTRWPELRGRDPMGFRYAVSAAAPLSLGVSQQVWERLQIRIVQGYGLSEVANFSCMMPTDLHMAAYARWMLRGTRTSVGPALPNQTVEVHEDGTGAAPGVDGEIVIRGPCVMSGYLHNSRATDEAFEGDWFHTGDIGYWLPDEAGHRYVHVSSRKREIAKRAGALVSLFEVDEVLSSIPGVVDSASAAFPNTWVDEEIGALVVREVGSTLSEEHVLDHCRRRLAYASAPKIIAFVDEIPRTPTGKVQRPRVADAFAPYRERLFVDSRRARPASSLAADATTKGDR